MTRRALLAAGRECDLYDLGDGWVSREYRDPLERCDLEVAAMEHARALGFPTPRVRAARGGVIEMERIDGPTMLDELFEDPGLARHHISLLGDLLEQLHEIPGPAWLPSPFGRPGVLLHMDLHPGNVIMSSRGPVVIDWSNVAAGPADIDLAQTWLLLSSTRVLPGADDESVRRGSELVVGEFMRRFPGATYLPHVVRAIDDRLADQKVPPVEAVELRRLRRSVQRRSRNLARREHAARSTRRSTAVVAPGWGCRDTRADEILATTEDRGTGEMR
jgi:hypothetical protein